MENKLPSYNTLPIQIGPHTIIQVHVYNNVNSLEYALTEDDKLRYSTPRLDKEVTIYEDAAKQFFHCVGDSFCDHFIQALRDEADKILEELRIKLK